MFDGEPQSSRSRRAHHQPVMIPRKMLVRNFFGEFAIIDFVIVPSNALFGHARRAPSLENVKWPPLESFGHPDFRLQIAQPFISKMRKTRQISEAFDFFGGVPAGLFSPIEP